MTLILTFASFLAILAITFLSCLPCRASFAAFAKAVHIHWIRNVLCSNYLECEKSSAGFNVGLNFASYQLVRDQSCTVDGKILFQLAWNEDFKCSCLDVFIKRCCRRSARIAFVSAHPLVESCAKVLQVAPIWKQDLSQKCSALPPLRGSQRRTKRRSASRRAGAASRAMSKLSLCQS